MDILALKWNNHLKILSKGISNLQNKSIYTDATLLCEGKFYKVHRFVLSICSEYFCEIFRYTESSNLIVVLKGIKCRDLEYLLNYMYGGEVNVRQNELSSLISAAETLQIKGLAVSDDDLSPKKTKIVDSSEIPNNHEKTMKSCENNKSFLKNDEVPNSPSESNCNSNSSSSAKLDSQDFSTFKEIKIEPDLNYDDKPWVEDSPYLDENIDEQSSGIDAMDFSNSQELNDTSISACAKTDDWVRQEDINVEDFHSQEITDDRHSNSDPSHARDSNHPQSLLPSVKTTTNAPSNVVSNQTEGYTGVLQFLSKRRRSQNANLSLKEFHCSYCGRTFNYKTNLLAHERIHTGEKPFHCLYCPFRSALKGNLKNHIYIKHNVDWNAIKDRIYPSTTH